jgi:hypothetical protein
MELAQSFGMVKTLRICIEQINGPLLCDVKGTPARHK